MKYSNEPSLIAKCGIVAALLGVAWMGVTQLVFAVRHPWATDVERLVWWREATMFRQVSYEEMRHREKGRVNGRTD